MATLSSCGQSGRFPVGTAEQFWGAQTFTHFLKFRSGTFPQQIVDRFEYWHIQSQRGESAKEQRIIPGGEERFSQPSGAADRGVPVAPLFWDVFQMGIARKDEGCGFRSPASDAGEAICAVAYNGQIIRNRLGLYPKLGQDTCLIAQSVAAPIQLHDARPDYRLAQIFIRRANDDSRHSLVLGSLRGR